MSLIRFQYKADIVSGGYAFSVHNKIITLSSYVEKLTDNSVREALHFEAERARQHYVTVVNQLKTLGESVNTFIIKRDAVAKAKIEAQAKFPDVWERVQKTREVYENRRTSLQPSTATVHADSERDPVSCNPSKEIKLTVTVKAPDNLTVDITKESGS